jgi:TatA/E family protein of Tat protein translocase
VLVFGISGFELVIIAAFALLIFGPEKIPEFARTAGRIIRQFKRTQEEMEAMVRAEMYGERKAKAAQTVGNAPATNVVPEMDDDDEIEEEEEE